jgi:hypothetical protein
MKITLALPDSVNGIDGARILQVNAGVIQGWKNLPPVIQKTIEWVGVEFTGINFYVKIKNKEGTLDVSFSVDDFFKQNIEQQVENLFRKTVLDGMEKIIEKLQEKAREVKRMLT